MTDRESVVQALKDSLKNLHCGFVEGVGDVYAVSEETINHILELLKEQRPKSVLSNRECETLPNYYERKGFCPKCHQEMKFILNRNYCGFCGQAVKWGKVVNNRIEVNK